MKIAVEGCSHGELDVIYRDILENERETGEQVDLVLLCGDIQALRNEADLPSLAVPDKYKRLGDFPSYYSGEKTAPILTLVIGGNHEASNYMWELYYGGWIASNIYYMGSSGCVEVNGLVIAAVSGIYKSRDYMCGRFERQPYSMSDLRSMYHTRVFDITKLGMLSSPDIFLSHDWPNGVEQHGDVQALVRQKPFFRDEISSTTLGSPPLQTLLYELRPRFWFSAHLHVRFAARVMHGQISSAPGPAHVPNPEALDLDDLDDESETEAVNKIPPSKTEFLALSKCTSRGDYLHDADLRSRVAKEELALATQWAEEDALNIRKVQIFEQTAPRQDMSPKKSADIYRNPQTDAFCQLIGIPNRINAQPQKTHEHATMPMNGHDTCSPEDEVARIRLAASVRKRKRAQRLTGERSHD
ncbi:lariat debranching enzyme [Malassezia nana]|uniref:Lariat debranching enzyme n=1 Tax=Malassezia nana TaxID=180528 RepID=A0AAF0J1L5_9BASI|nr:lariat debranching enzyme [Malassezia nana]